MTNDLIPFNYGDHRIRVVHIDGEPEFVSADVCAVLDHSNPTMAVAGLDEDERGLRNVETPSGMQQMVTVTEAGLYALIIRSRKPEAKPFKRWITHEVLPAIRKTGGYGNRELTRLELIDIAREAEVGRIAAEEKLAIAAPKADYVDSFVNGDTDASTIRVLANQLQIGEKALRARLVEAKAIYQKLQGRRYSRTQNRMVAEYSWHAYATHRTWFVERDQPEAPRYHNGQVRTTLYVTPVGKVKIAALVARVGEAS